MHLPLQSGSDRILKAMHRTYTAEKYLRLVDQIRDAAPNDIALTTDVIVGFPGETEEDYEMTRALVERVQFDNAFVFRYSPRRETPAAEMPAQVDEAVKEARNQDLLSVVDASAKRAGERLVGRTVEILCEGPSKTNPARLTGRTRANKIVVFEGSEADVGQLLDLRVTHSTGFSLSGTREGGGGQLCSGAKRGNSASARRGLFMIYHFSLHAAGLIAGLLLIAAQRSRLLACRRARCSRSFRVRARPAWCC